MSAGGPWPFAARIPPKDAPLLPPMTVARHAIAALGLLVAATSCASFGGEELRFPDDMTGKNILGVSTGWAFVESDIDLENGQGPLANPVLGGSDVGSSTTDLDPVFGIGIKYQRYLTNNILLGFIYEHRIFDPESTRPLSADVDIDDFGTDHFIIDARYQFDPIDKAERLRPFAGVQIGYVPEVKADGDVNYDGVPPLNIGPSTERISLDGSDFFTLGFVVGGSYLIREDLTLDFGAFYEFALNPTEDQLVLNPYPGNPPLDQPSTYDGELLESGLYLTAGISWVF